MTEGKTEASTDDARTATKLYPKRVLQTAETGQFVVSECIPSQRRAWQVHTESSTADTGLSEMTEVYFKENTVQHLSPVA